MFHQVEQARRMLMTRRVLRVWLVTGAVVARTRIVSSGQLLPRTRFWNVRCWRSGSPDRFPNALLGVLASVPPRHPCCVDPLRAWSLASPAGTTGCRVDIAFSRAPRGARGGSSRVSRWPANDVADANDSKQSTACGRISESIWPLAGPTMRRTPSRQSHC